MLQRVSAARFVGHRVYNRLFVSLPRRGEFVRIKSIATVSNSVESCPNVLPKYLLQEFDDVLLFSPRELFHLFHVLIELALSASFARGLSGNAEEFVGGTSVDGCSLDDKLGRGVW